MWYSDNMFHYVFKAEIVMLISLKVPSGLQVQLFLPLCKKKWASGGLNRNLKVVMLFFLASSVAARCWRFIWFHVLPTDVICGKLFEKKIYWWYLTDMLGSFLFR